MINLYKKNNNNYQLETEKPIWLFIFIDYINKLAAGGKIAIQNLPL